MVSYLLQQSLRMLAPPECIDCGQEGRYLCFGCRQRLPKVPQRCCMGCRRPNRTGITCRLCRPLLAISGHTVMATYDGVIEELIGRLKYHHQREIASELGSWLATEIDPTNFDYVMAVPAATNRLRARGYNQAELIAKALSRQTRLPYRRLLRRARNVRQVGTHRSERQRQAITTFASAGQIKPGQRILLIDDVLTTGATLNACAQILTRDHRAMVWAATIARADQ